MKCPRCIRRLRPDAVSCICGWSSATSTVSMPAVVVDYGALERERASYARWVDAGSPTAEQSIAKIRAILKKPRLTPHQHWERVLRTPNAPWIAQEYAKAALRRNTEIIDREPGSDDELVPISRYAA